jgi:copper chaperone NosL
MEASKIARVLVATAAFLMVIAYYVPIWEILMWAPQYPEWLSMKIWINNITGDVAIINGLNHYIGMKYIKVEMFPEFKFMPYILGALIAMGIAVAIIGKRKLIWIYLGVLIVAGIAGMVDFYLWGYDYGHNLDPTAAIKVPGMSYQPPLIGSKQLLNFIAYSGPDIGGYVIAFSGILVIAAIVIDYRLKKKKIGVKINV